MQAKNRRLKQKEQALLKALDEIPGGDGWWQQSTQAAFHQAGLELLEAGLSPERIVDLLGGLYQATAGEFGG